MTGDAMLSGATAVQALDRVAALRPDGLVCFPGTLQSLSLAELATASRAAAAGLVAQGVRPGDTVGVLMQTRAEFLVALFGVLRTGAAASVLPTPAGAKDVTAQVGRLAYVADKAQMRHVVADDVMAPLVPLVALAASTANPQLVRLADLAGDPAAAPEGADVPDAVAVVQFTSGSTSDPKGVVLQHRTLMAGLRACVVSGAFTTDDVFLQWVPHFHDMGLIGLLSHLLNGAPVHVLSPLSFIRHPDLFLRYVAQHRVTVFTGPNFSYDHLCDAVRPDLLAELDLSSCRLAFNGAEPVDAGSVERFTRTFGPVGFPSWAMYPVYGMAEATLAITFPNPGSEPVVAWLDRERLGDGAAVRVPSGSPRAKALVSVGKPVHGLQLQIAGPDGTAIEDGRLGEVQLRGEAVTPGYFRNPEADAEAYVDGWFRTGDLAVVLDGELYVTGRSKDMIVVRGANYFAEDVEALAREAPGVYRSNCVAVSEAPEGGTEHLAVLVEVMPSADPEVLARALLASLRRELGLDELVVHAVSPRWLPRTTSGKWRRSAARQQLRSGERPPLASAGFAPADPHCTSSTPAPPSPSRAPTREVAP